MRREPPRLSPACEPQGRDAAAEELRDLRRRRIPERDLVPLAREPPQALEDVRADRLPQSAASTLHADRAQLLHRRARVDVPLARVPGERYDPRPALRRTRRGSRRQSPRASPPSSRCRSSRRTRRRRPRSACACAASRAGRPCRLCDSGTKSTSRRTPQRFGCSSCGAGEQEVLRVQVTRDLVERLLLAEEDARVALLPEVRERVGATSCRWGGRPRRRAAPSRGAPSAARSGGRARGALASPRPSCSSRRRRRGRRGSRPPRASLRWRRPTSAPRRGG